MINLSFDFDLFNNYYYFYERLIVILFSLVPSLIAVGIVVYADRKSKEPSKNILICLLSGILTISLASYLEGLVMPYISSSVTLTYVWAAIEELSKMAIFYLFIFDNKHFDDINDGVVYMMIIALSFAGLENIMYAFSESTISNSISLAIMRDLTTIPLHVICGIVIGFFLSIGYFSKDKKKKYINIFLAILLSTVIHGTFNLLMGILGNLQLVYSSTLGVLFLQAIPLLVIMIILFMIAIRTLKNSFALNYHFVECEPYDEKYSYLMNSEEYEESNLRKKRLYLHKKTTFYKENIKEEE